jgi:catechol 2,3-dioxygenase
MTTLPFAATTPVSVGRIGLRAKNAPALAEFYRDVVGLEEMGRQDGAITLGAGGRPLLVLEAAPAARPDDPRSAGLFHTAFLLPERADLARWVKRAIDRRIPVDGASDHLVSEALYLTDPEGNGIEIYADRPRDAWTWNGDSVAIATLPLDIRGLVGSLPEADGGWQGAPPGSVVGHVHLRVGDPEEAEAFWNSEMGYDTDHRLAGSAVFLSSGGYHHHVGANSWQSRGAGRRADDRSGLAWVELLSDDFTGGEAVSDPWGTMIRRAPRLA